MLRVQYTHRLSECGRRLPFRDGACSGGCIGSCRERPARNGKQSARVAIALAALSLPSQSLGSSRATHAAHRGERVGYDHWNPLHPIAVALLRLERSRVAAIGDAGVFDVKGEGVSPGRSKPWRCFADNTGIPDGSSMDGIRVGAPGIAVARFRTRSRGRGSGHRERAPQRSDHKKKTSQPAEPVRGMFLANGPGS